MDKKEQEKLITEIMEADAKDGLYSISANDARTHTINEIYLKPKQMEKREMVLLLNWILKHYETHTDSNYMFCWKSSSGQELNSVDLVEQYIKEKL